MTTQYDPNDPYAVATAVAEAPDMRFGQAHVEARFVALVKGQGKVDFDNQVHDKRFTEITIRVDPNSDSGRTYFDKREMLAEFGDWVKTVWPSLAELGLKSVRDLHGKWCKYEMAVTGQYTNKNGEKRDATAFKFLELYADEATCEAAFEEFQNTRYTVSAPSESDAAAASVDMSSGAGDTDSTGTDTERETALQFLKVLVKQHGTNKQALAAAIESMPMVSRFFSVDSPEAQAA